MDTDDDTASVFGPKMILTASKTSTIEPAVRVAKLVFNEASLDSTVAGQLEPLQPRSARL